MARSGDFDTNNDRIVYWIEAIQNSQNVGANTSNVTVRVWVKRTNTGYTSYGTGTVYVTINGSNYTDSLTTNDKITSSPLKILEKTVNIAHSADGSKTLGLSARISHSVFSSSSHSWNFGLTDIPRTSKPTVNDSSINYGGAVTIYTNRASGSFAHTLRYNWNGNTGTIATNVETSHSWTVPLSFMNYITTSTSTRGTIYCDTYSGGKKIGTESISITTSIPSNIVPSFSSVTHSENVADVKSKIGAYVQGLSKLNLAITGATGTYGSAIQKYEIVFNGVTYTGSSVVSGLIKSSGTLTITGRVTDSRGRTASKDVSITVLAYEPPKITNFKVERANADGTLNEMGTHAKITRAGTWRSLNSKNSATIEVKSKSRGVTTWTTNNTIPAGTGGSYNASIVIGPFDVTKSHDFRVEFIDQFNTTISLVVLPTGVVTMSWGPNGVGIGKIWEKGTLDVQDDLYVPSIKGKEDVTIGRPPVIVQQGSWIKVSSFLNGWSNYGNGYTSMQYRKTAEDTVQIYGMVKNSNVNVGNTDITRLPIGFRPSSLYVAQTQMYLNGGGAGRARINILTDGAVHYQVVDSSGNASWIFFDIEFPITLL